jgi:hemerythrin-like domain-containing protein
MLSSEHAREVRMPQYEPANPSPHRDPIDQLRAEHEVIGTVLAAMAREAAALRQGGPVRRDFWHRAADFLEHFADRCHHGKEEEDLFPVLAAAGLSHEHGPMHALETQHEHARTGRKALLQAVQRQDRVDLARTVDGYVAAMRQHIHSEDCVLFPLVHELLHTEQMRHLRDQFAAHERALGEGVHQHYRGVARALERDAGLAVTA